MQAEWHVPIDIKVRYINKGTKVARTNILYSENISISKGGMYKRIDAFNHRLLLTSIPLRTLLVGKGNIWNKIIDMKVTCTQPVNFDTPEKGGHFSTLCSW